jgi:hypothetical protein
MLRTFRLLPALAVLGGMLAVPPSYAQTPAPDPLPGLPHPPDVPRSLMAPAPASPYRCADLPEPYFVHDALLDPPDFPRPGWFLNAEIDIVAPHIIGVQTDTVQIGANAPDIVALPAAGLAWTVAPRLQVGYRLPSAFGEFALAYRGLSTSGNATTAGLDGTAALHSRLDFNQIDADYLTREFSLLPCWGMKWHLGLRLAYVYYDSRADEPTDVAAAGSTVFEQRFSNSYWGLGPHAGVELERRFEGTGLSVVGRIDGAGLLGRIRQGFFEQSTTLDANGQFTTGETPHSGSQDVPILNLQIGVAWHPPSYPDAQLFLGYVYEQWWNVGKISSVGTAAQLVDQGILLRLAINF